MHWFIFVLQIIADQSLELNSMLMYDDVITLCDIARIRQNWIENFQNEMRWKTTKNNWFKCGTNADELEMNKKENLCSENKIHPPTHLFLWMQNAHVRSVDVGKIDWIVVDYPLPIRFWYISLFGTFNNTQQQQ